MIGVSRLTVTFLCVVKCQGVSHNGLRIVGHTVIRVSSLTVAVKAQDVVRCLNLYILVYNVVNGSGVRYPVTGVVTIYSSKELYVLVIGGTIFQITVGIQKFNCRDSFEFVIGQSVEALFVDDVVFWFRIVIDRVCRPFEMFRCISSGVCCLSLVDYDPYFECIRKHKGSPVRIHLV
jgi:hypothetical protein